MTCVQIGTLWYTLAAETQYHKPSNYFCWNDSTNKFKQDWTHFAARLRTAQLRLCSIYLFLRLFWV
jgi:hypothetical protein